MSPPNARGTYFHLLILNHFKAAKTTEKSWSLTTNSKFSAICCWAASMLHPEYLISRITLCSNTTLFLQWLQTISYIVFSNISDIWQVEKTSFTIKSGLFISLQVIWSQSPWFEYCSYARFIHLVSLFSVFVTYRHSSISAVSISTIFNLSRFIILS